MRYAAFALLALTFCATSLVRPEQIVAASAKKPALAPFSSKEFEGMVLTGNDSIPEGNIISRPFAVDGGRYYRLRAEIKSEGLHGGLYVLPADMALQLGGQTVSCVLTGNDSPFTYELTLRSPPDAWRGYVSFRVIAPAGRIEIQHIECEPVQGSREESFDLLVAGVEDLYVDLASSPANWDSLVAHYRPTAARAVDFKAFTTGVGEMLGALHDERIFLSSWNVTGKWYPTYLSDDYWDNLASPLEFDYRIARSAVDSLRYLQGSHWGWLSGRIAYLQYGNPDVHITDPKWAAGLLDLLSADGFIIDLRRAGFFSDAEHASLKREELQRFVGLFAQSKTQYAWSERTTGRHQLWIKPTPIGAPGRPVICLIDHHTGGIYADAALMLSALSNVRLVGQTTSGGSMRPVPVTTPEGLVAYVPSERFYDMRGHRITDESGIAPDVETETDCRQDVPFTTACQLLKKTLH